MTYVSIGENCVMARQLFLHGLRDCSFPFDWACSNPLAIIDFLDSDINERRVSKHYYGFTNDQLYWPHHNEFLTDDKCFEYVSRCKERLVERLSEANDEVLNGDKVTFLHFTAKGETNFEALNKFSEYISSKYPQLNFTIYSGNLRLIESGNDFITWKNNHCTFNVKKLWCVEINDWSGENNNSELWKEFFETITSKKVSRKMIEISFD